MEKLQKQINKLPKEYAVLCLELIERLVRRDLFGLHIIRLKGHTHTFRVRSGRLRIVYTDDGTQVIIREASLRNDNTYRNY